MLRVFRFAALASLALALLGSLFLTAGARTTVSAAQATDANKAVVRQLYALFNKGDLNGMSAVVDANVVDHTAGPNQAAGIEGLKQDYTLIRSGFPDIMIKEDNLIADGDKVADRLTAAGTHTAQFFGIPPSNKPVMFDLTDIYRIANGKIVEIWHIEDLGGLLFQILPPPPGQTPPPTMNAVPPSAPTQSSAATQAAGGAQASATDLKTLATNVYQTFNQDFKSGSFDNLNQYFAPNYVEHETNSGQPGGMSDLIQGLTQLRAAIPDAQFQLEDVLVEGNMLAARNRLTGTQTGTFGPMPPSNNKVNSDTIDFVRVENGKIVEHWSVMDTLSFLTQIGALQLPGQAAPTMAATSASK